MPLIKFGETAVQVDIGWILRSIVAVEIRRRVEGLAVSVIPEQRKMIAEALLDFQNAALVKSVRLRAVGVVLDHQRIHEAVNSWIITGQASGFSASQRVGSRRRRIPIAIGNNLAIGEWQRGKRRRQQIGIDRNRQSLSMRINTAYGDGESRRDLTFNSKRSLLCDGRPIARLIRENYLQRSDGTAVRNINAKR